MTDSKQVKLRTYMSLVEAEGARAYLAAHDVAATIPDQHAVTMQPHLVAVFGGIRLMIENKDIEKAEALLSEVERRSHLKTVSEEDGFPEGYGPSAEPLSGNKKRLVQNFSRFLILTFVVYYAIQAFKHWGN